MIDKVFSDYFSFHFINNRINNNWAPQGLFAFFENTISVFKAMFNEAMSKNVDNFLFFPILL